MVLLIIALIIAAVWIVSLYYQLEQAKSSLSKLPGAVKEIDTTIEALDAEIVVLKRALLNVVKGINQTVDEMANARSKKELEKIKKSYSEHSVAAQTASIYIANLHGTGYTTELLKKIYREHNLPEHFSSQLAGRGYEIVSGKQIDSDTWKTNYEKYEKMLTRMLKTDFENMQEEMDSEAKRMKEISDKSYKEFGL